MLKAPWPPGGGASGSGEVYEWFTEGFETTDLRAARATLDELDAGVPGPAPPVAS